MANLSVSRYEGWPMDQLRKAAHALSVLALPAAMLVAGSCGDDDSTGNQLSNADLVGGWSLVSFQIIPQRALTPPITTGTLRLSDTSYDVLVVLNTGEAVDTVVADSGTYTVSGSSWSQTSDNPDVPPATGTVVLIVNAGSEILEVNATTAGVDTHSFWMRQE
jgi:hypothetical protein